MAELEELRELSLYADGIMVAREGRLRLRGRSTMSLRPDLWEVYVKGYSSADMARLTAASRLEVRGKYNSTLCEGVKEELSRFVEDGHPALNLMISDGMAFWRSHVSCSIAGGNTAQAALRLLLKKCASPVSLATNTANDRKMVRGQAFFGRTADCVSMLAKGLDARAYFSRGALHLVSRGQSATRLTLNRVDLPHGVQHIDGAYLADLRHMVGYPVGVYVSLPDMASPCRILAQSFDADNHEGLWTTSLLLAPDDRFETLDDWSGGI